MKVLNFGSMNLDYVYQVPRFVRPGETLSAASQTVKAGGKGLNQSIALARAGAQVWHAGCVGRGGETLTALLAENGVHTDFVRPVPELQGNAVIQVDREGDNCILLFGGSNLCVTGQQVDETLAAFAPGDWLVLQNEINLTGYAAERGAAMGLTVVLNPSPMNDRLQAVDFSRLDWVLLNEIEAEQLTGRADPAEAWAKLHGRYPRLSVLITLGAEGSVAWQVRDGRVETCRQAAFPVRPVDTTAAGDTYTGYLICGLTEGRPLADCMRRASCAAALAVTRLGAADSIPYRDETDTEGKKHE